MLFKYIQEDEMFKSIIRPIAMVAVVIIVLLSGFAGTAMAVAEEPIDGSDPVVEEPHDGKYVQIEMPTYLHVIDIVVNNTDDEEESQVKKAFNTAQQQIQHIKKGDESPVEELPTFFGEE